HSVQVTIFLEAFNVKCSHTLEDLGRTLFPADAFVTSIARTAVYLCVFVLVVALLSNMSSPTNG
ncbi:hypothetical protein M9458_057601, partial [Cirrhinus mrigala]